MKCLESGMPREQRLAAMALGRLGETRAVSCLLNSAGWKEIRSLSMQLLMHSLSQQTPRLSPRSTLSHTILQMSQVKRNGAPAHTMPEIRLAEVMELAPEVTKKQEARLVELEALLPGGDPERGREIFQNTSQSLCLTCHVMGELGVEFGPDLTKIGAIRSERDLLEAIVYPSATIARYYEMVIVKKKSQGELPA